jgi:hypothetical protein
MNIRASAQSFSRIRLEELRRMGFSTESGVVYDYEQSHGRFNIKLIKEPHHDGRDIYKAAAQLARDRYIVGDIFLTDVESCIEPATAR